MLGTVVNSLAIFIGGSVGSLFGSKFSKRYSDIILNGISLSVLLVGLLSALKTENVLLVIISMGLGSLIGEFINIENKLTVLGDMLQKKFKNSNSTSNIAEGFVTATLIYCIGSMAILGAIESGVTGNHTTLFAKAIIDGVTAIVFSTTLGIGVALSAVSVFIYQGMITLLSSQVSEILTVDAIRELSAVGGLLIMAIGLNVLKITKIKVGNMLPAVFLPVLFYVFKGMFL